MRYLGSLISVFGACLAFTLITLVGKPAVGGGDDDSHCVYALRFNTKCSMAHFNEGYPPDSSVLWTDKCPQVGDGCIDWSDDNPRTSPCDLSVAEFSNTTINEVVQSGTGSDWYGESEEVDCWKLIPCSGTTIDDKICRTTVKRCDIVATNRSCVQGCTVGLENVEWTTLQQDSLSRCQYE